MTNEITTSKAELALDLQNAGLEVLDYVPERVVPPIVIISADSTYLSQDNITNSYTLGLKLTLVAASATNELATESLDELISDTVLAIAGLSYAVMRSVQNPYRLAVNTAEYLATDLTLDLSITL